MCNQPTVITPDVLLEAMQREQNSIARYSLLQELAADPRDAGLLQSIHKDGAQHLRALSRLYRQLTGTNPPSPAEEAQPVSTFREDVGQSVLQKLQDSQFYRCIALECDNPSRRMFFDMMEDENKHAAWLHYLYVKSAQECCPQTPEPGPEPVVCEGIAHAVQPGESLWAIARQYAVTVEALLEANPQIADPENIYAGQIVCIPCGGFRYTVQAGDSLWQIARRHGITVEELLASNPFLTDAGNIGAGQVICIPCCPEPPAPPARRESLTYLYGGTSDGYLKLLSDTRDSLTTVCPNFFEIDGNGNLLLATANKLNRAFIQELHRRDIRVVPFISNHFSRELGMTALSNREGLSAQLAAAVEEYGLDGVNVDIENLTERSRDSYVDFARLLREKLPEGKTVSVAVAANPNGWTTGWHGSYNYAGLSRYCDYLVIMAYDESYQGGPEGPVSSSGFLERSIQYALDQGVPTNRIIAAIPFFGRYWKLGDPTGGVGLADRDVENLLDNYSSTQHYDEATRSALAVVTIHPGEPEPQIWGGRSLSPGTYRIWYDSPAATRYKLETISRYGLLGAGSWALGQEIPAVWDFYSQALHQ